MKKVPVTESKEANKPDLAKERSTSSPEKPAALSEVDRIEAEDPMAGLQADLDRFRDLALRSQADFENYKKRCAREKEEAIKYANSSLLERLVVIVDNFELGLSAAREESESSPIYSGMNLVLKQLNDFLAENGLQPIEAVGQKFDPNTCTKRLRMNRARSFQKERSFARPAAVIVLKTDFCGLQAWWSPAVRRNE